MIMPLLFRENKIGAAGNVLPFGEARLFSDLKKQEIPKWREAKIIAKAEQYLDREIPFLPASVYMEFARNGNRSNYEGIYFTRRDMMMYLSVAESIERKGRFTDKLLDVIWAILEETSWVIPAHNSNHHYYPDCPLPAVYGDFEEGIDLFSAATAGTMALAYHLCNKELAGITPRINDRILYELDRRIIRPYLTQEYWWSGAYGNAVNNWNPWINSNVLSVLLLCVKDDYTRNAVVAKVMTSLDCFTKFYPEDGGCDEGPSYWGAAPLAYFDCLELLYDISGGKIDIFHDPFIKKMAEYRVNFNINGKYVVNFADCGHIVGCGGAHVYRFGERCGVESLMALASEQTAPESDFSLHHFHPLATYKDMMQTVPSGMRVKYPRLVWMNGLKVLIARECDESDKGLFLAFRGGNNGESHNHNDVGSFIVYSDGAPLIIDAGVGQYCKKTFSPQRYEIWSMQSTYHNLPDINGYAELPGGAYHSSNEVFDEKSGEAKMNIGGAYPADAGIELYERSAVLSGGTVRITDHIKMKRPSEIVFHMLLAEDAEIAGKGVIKLAGGRTLTYPADTLTAEIEKYHCDDGMIERNWKREYLPRINFTAKGVTEGEFLFEIK